MYDPSQAPKPRDDYTPRAQRAPQAYKGRRIVRLYDRAYALYRNRKPVPGKLDIVECALGILMEVDRLRKQVSGLNAHDALNCIERKLAEATNISRDELFDVRNLWEKVEFPEGLAVTYEDEYDANAPLTFGETEENPE